MKENAVIFGIIIGFGVLLAVAFVGFIIWRISATSGIRFKIETYLQRGKRKHIHHYFTNEELVRKLTDYYKETRLYEIENNIHSNSFWSISDYNGKVFVACKSDVFREVGSYDLPDIRKHYFQNDQDISMLAIYNPAESHFMIYSRYSHVEPNQFYVGSSGI